MRFPKTGDLVVQIEDLEVKLYSWWGNKGLGNAPVIGKFKDGIALVLKDTLDAGGNGARILTHDGQVGWTYITYLSVME